MRVSHYSFFRSFCSSVLVVGLPFVCALGCGDSSANPRSVRGALSAAASAIESQDALRLFRVIDQRARFAMASIVDSRKQAKQLIEADYPQNERAAALASLGDAAQANDAAALFALRCTGPCMQGLGAKIGAPSAEQRSGNEVEVRTARGVTLHMHAGKDGAFGLVWNTTELSDERDRAARELQQIRENAEVYRRRRALDAAGEK